MERKTAVSAPRQGTCTRPARRCRHRRPVEGARSMATMPMEATTTLKATSSACAGAMDDDDDDDSPSPFDGRALTAGGGYIKTIKSNSFFGTLYVVVAILQVFSPGFRPSVRPRLPATAVWSRARRGQKRCAPLRRSCGTKSCAVRVRVPRP